MGFPKYVRKFQPCPHGLDRNVCYTCVEARKYWENWKPKAEPTLSTERNTTMTVEQLKLLYKILETKNSWGKNEIKTLILEVVSGIRTE